MQRSESRIQGVLVVTPDVFGDERGFFMETYARTKYGALGITEAFVQDNVSVSTQNVVRGLHGDPMMSKLVQVVRGAAFDVVVDARQGSPTFGTWEAFVLSEENHHQVNVPRGCLHGFQALSDLVVLSYKQSAEYDPERELGVLWEDRALAIDWPAKAAAVVSARDRSSGAFTEILAAAPTPR